jgi:glycosyl transferase, family 25
MIRKTPVAGPRSSTLLNNFEFVSIINLPDRTDRRRDMERQLEKIGLPPRAGHVEFFPAVRVTAVDDWPSLGARGCFLSHYTVLKQALERRLPNILVIEDDCEFAPITEEFEHETVRTLRESPWDIVHLGHYEKPEVSGPPTLIPWDRPTMGAHLYAVNLSALGRLVNFLEQVMQRPNGHPEGGPQHYDGALTMFRAQNKDLVTLIAAPSIAGQRSSRSDIHQGRWFDRVPGLRAAANGVRRIMR